MSDFRSVVWAIIGGPTVNLTIAAARLRLRKHTLKAILVGKTKISQRFVVAHEWPELFALHYPQRWQELEGEFRRCYETLSRRPGAATKRPANEKSFGYTLWCIIGGAGSELWRVGPLLGVHPNTVGDILHGRKLPRAMLHDYGWVKALARAFPETWKRYEGDFYIHLNELRRRRFAGKDPQGASTKS